METKYNQIGNDYNITRKADPYLVKLHLKHLQPKEDGIYLDIGCGTGNYTNEFQKGGISFIGIDPSIKMLKKAKQINRNIDWRIGFAEDIGLPENSIDGIIASLTIHHWTNLEKGFAELQRIIKPGGRIVIFTATPKQMKGYWLNHYFPNMLSDSIVQMPSFSRVKEAMSNCGFEITKTDKYFIQADLEDKFLFSGKHSPEVYFDKRIRNGISSFASLANQDEVKQGLYKLRRDISTNKIISITKSYENEFGDYLFIIGKSR